MQLRKQHILAVLLVLTAGSLVPLPATSGTATIPITSLGHLIGYGVLAFCIAVVFQATGFDGLVAVGVATVVGTGIELLQVYVPTRSFAWSDIMLNTAGATMGATIAVAINRKQAHEDNLGEKDIPDGHE